MCQRMEQLFSQGSRGRLRWSAGIQAAGTLISRHFPAADRERTAGSPDAVMRVHEWLRNGDGNGKARLSKVISIPMNPSIRSGLGRLRGVGRGPGGRWLSTHPSGRTSRRRLRPRRHRSKSRSPRINSASIPRMTKWWASFRSRTCRARTRSPTSHAASTLATKKFCAPIRASIRGCRASVARSWCRLSSYCRMHRAKGLVVNLAQLRVFYYPKPAKLKKGEVDDGLRTVITHPIGIGKIGWQTPEGSTKVTSKQKNPTWTPPVSVRKEHKENGDPLPARVPPGPDNPLGALQDDARLAELSDPRYEQALRRGHALQPRLHSFLSGRHRRAVRADSGRHQGDGRQPAVRVWLAARTRCMCRCSRCSRTTSVSIPRARRNCSPPASTTSCRRSCKSMPPPSTSSC